LCFFIFLCGVLLLFFFGGGRGLGKPEEMGVGHCDLHSAAISSAPFIALSGSAPVCRALACSLY